MQVIGLVLGILTMGMFFIAVVPFLGWLNWYNIPMACLGLGLSIYGIARSKGRRTCGIIGIILCSIAIFFGLIRLSACGGII